MAEAIMEIDGAEAIIKMLRVLPDKTSIKAAKAGLRAGGNVILKQARKNIRKHSPTIAKALGLVVPKKRAPKGMAFLIIRPRPGHYHPADVRRISDRLKMFRETGASTGLLFTQKGEIRKPMHAGPTAVWMEFGTEGHDIKVPRKGKHQITIHHPGMTPRPFMRPAFDAKTPEAIRKAHDKMIEIIEKEAEKLGNEKVARKARRLDPWRKFDWSRI